MGESGYQFLKRRSPLAPPGRVSLLFQVEVPITRPLTEIFGVHLDVGLILGRHVFLGEDSLWRTNRHASAAVNASVRINVKILAPHGVTFVPRDNTVHRADFNTVTLTGA